MSSKRSFIAFAIFFIACLLVYSLNLFTSSMNTMKISMLVNEAQKSMIQNYVTPKPKRLNTTGPIILLWTPYFSGDWIKKGFTVDCMRNKCSAVSDRSYLQYADAILFHWLDIVTKDLPKMRYFHQKWVLYNMESPSNTYYVRSIMEAVQKEIDWTMSYRLDSDVYAPYGKLVKANHSNYRAIALKDKKRPVAWFVSNCYTAGKRETFVKELSLHIQVDIYGRCGKKQCPRRDDRKCLEMVAKNYVFYLSFENSICKDYLTEKIFRIMAYNVIPVVFGGANYTDILPANSFIDALAFKSPKNLSDYLKYVMSNETVYNTYFEWKRSYSAINTIDWCLCFLCDKILENRHHRNERLNRNLVKWWFDEAQCTAWKKPK